MPPALARIGKGKYSYLICATALCDHVSSPVPRPYTAAALEHSTGYEEFTR